MGAHRLGRTLEEERHRERTNAPARLSGVDETILMENFSYLFAAYSIIFAVIFLYVMLLWRRQARLDHRLRRLEAQLRKVQEGSAENN
jgi:CcmD family protein